MQSTILWALLANGRHARIVENPGSKQYQKCYEVDPKALGTTDFTSTETDLKAIERLQHGPLWHRDPIRQQERVYAVKLSAYLLRNMEDNHFHTLVVAAAPRTLGDLMQVFPERLQKRLVCKVARDLIGVPDQEIGDVILELLRESPG